MSGQIIGQVIGTVIGTMVGGPIGGAIGGGLGGAVGSSFDSLPTQYGPRLDDLRVQKSEYGAPIPIVYGTVAIQGNVIWAADIKEVQTETEQGGKGGPSQTTVNYSYLGSFAVLLCEGEIEDVGRIWAGPAKRLIWDGAKLESGTLRVYRGTDDQEPDSLMEQYEGVGNVPAYRGYAYIVIEEFELAKDGNTLPFLTIEVGASSGGSCPIPASTVEVDGQTYSIYDPAPVKIADVPVAVSQYGRVFSDAITGWMYYTYANDVGYWYLDRINPDTGESGTPIGLGTGAYKMAWNNYGNVRIVESGGIDMISVDLVSWTFSRAPALRGIVCGAGETLCAPIDVPVADIVWSESGTDQEFRLLSYSNSVDGYSVGVPGVEDVDTVIHRLSGLQPSVMWGSTGERVGGDLTPMWGDVGAAHFLTQNSNFASKPNIYWDAYDTKRGILVDFAAGAYTSPEGYIDGIFSRPDVGEGQAVYSPAQDMFYVVDGLNIRAYDPEKLSPSGWEPEDCILFNGAVRQAYEGGEPIPAGAGMRVFVLPKEPDWLGVITLGGGIMKIFIGGKGRTNPNWTTLATVVADLSERAGETRYDVSQFESDIVDGYAIARQTMVRAAIDALRPAYYFDAVESQGVIKYVKRGGAAVASIDDADLAAHDAGGEPPDPLKTVRRMEVELPRSVNVKYLLAADDYSQATKQAKRLIGSSGDEQTIELPLVLSDTKAQEVADVNLHAAWAERLSYSFSLPRKYSYLEPTDLVVVKGHLMRLTKINATPRGVLECEAVADETTYYSPHVVVTETPPNGGTVSQPGETLMELF
jgi:hypothetical protein